MKKEIVVSNGEVNIATVLEGEYNLFGAFEAVSSLFGGFFNNLFGKAPMKETQEKTKPRKEKEDNIQSMTVLKGGVAIGTNVSGFATALTVKKGGTAVNAKIESMGELIIEKGGIAAGVELGAGGILTIQEGTIATSINARSNSSISFPVAQNTYIQGMIGGTAFEMKEGILSNFIIGIGIELIISNGGTASKIILNGGKLTVRKGGKALDVLKVSGDIIIEEGAIVTYVSSKEKPAKKTKRKTGLEISPYYVEKGAQVADLTIANAQKLVVCKSGMATNTTVEKGGEIIVRAEATGKGIILNGGKLTVRKGGLAMDVVNMGGEVNAEAGGVVTYAPAPVKKVSEKKTKKRISAEKITEIKNGGKKTVSQKTKKNDEAKKARSNKKTKS